MTPTCNTPAVATVDEALATLRGLRYHLVEGKLSASGWEVRRLADGGATLSVPPAWAGHAQISAVAIVADLRVRGMEAVAQVLDLKGGPAFSGMIVISGRRIQPSLADVAGYVHNQSGWPRAREITRVARGHRAAQIRAGDGGIAWAEAEGSTAFAACYRESRPGQGAQRPRTTRAHHAALGALLRTLLTPLGYVLRNHTDRYTISPPRRHTRTQEQQ